SAGAVALQRDRVRKGLAPWRFLARGSPGPRIRLFLRLPLYPVPHQVRDYLVADLDEEADEPVDLAGVEQHGRRGARLVAVQAGDRAVWVARQLRGRDGLPGALDLEHEARRGDAACNRDGVRVDFQRGRGCGFCHCDSSPLSICGRISSRLAAVYRSPRAVTLRERLPPI